MFSMATRIFPVETNRKKAFGRDSIKHFDSAFWLGCAFRNCRLYCVFSRIAPPPCLRSSIEWYTFFAIYLFNLASAKLHCLQNIRIFTSEIYIARDDITTIFHNFFYRWCPYVHREGLCSNKSPPNYISWSKKTSRYDHFGAWILRYHVRVSVGYI